MPPTPPPRADPAPDRPRWRHAAAAGATLLVTGVIIGGAHLTEGILTTADFDEYCGGISWLRDLELGQWPRKRSRLAGLLPAVWARGFGIIDGLTLAAWASVVATGAGLYLWGQAVAGRLGGWSTVLLAAATPPLALLPRMLSFYPETVAVFVLAAAAAAWAIRFPGTRSITAASVLAGLVFLIDLRGLLWGLPLAGLVALVALRARRWRWLAGLAAALTAAWLAGPLAYGPDTPSLEQQAWEAAHVQDRDRGHPGPDPDQGYVWGRSSPLEIPGTLIRLVGMEAHPGCARMPGDHGFHLPDDQVIPWGMAGVAGAALTILLGWRDPRRLVALLGPATPFVASGASAVANGLLEPRTLAVAAPGVVALAACGLVSAGRRAAGLRRRALTATGPLAVAGLALLWLNIIGVLPGLLSPTAAWRAPVKARQQPVDHLVRRALREEQPRARLRAACVGALRADIAAGHLPMGRLLVGPPAPTPPR